MKKSKLLNAILLACLCSSFCTFGLTACDAGNIFDSTTNINDNTTNINYTDYSDITITNNGVIYTLSKDGTYYIVSGLEDTSVTDVVIVSENDGIPVKKIGYSAFYSEDELFESESNDTSKYSDIESITIPDSVTTIGNAAFMYCDSLTSITIPDSVTTIGHNAFVYCESLTTIIIPDSVTSISSYAFNGCTSLTTVIIGKGVSSLGGEPINNIGDELFGSCYSLTNIEVDEDNKYFKSVDGNLYSKDGTKFIRYASGKTDETFVMPNEVTSMGDFAFAFTKALKSVTIADGVTSIGNGSFWECTSLMDVIIPDKVTSLTFYLFRGCSSLTSITIPKSVTSISSGALVMCDNIKTVYYKGTEEEWKKIENSDSITNKASVTIIYNA